MGYCFNTEELAQYIRIYLLMLFLNLYAMFVFRTIIKERGNRNVAQLNKITQFFALIVVIGFAGLVPVFVYYYNTTKSPAPFGSFFIGEMGFYVVIELIFILEVFQIFSKLCRRRAQ